MSNSANQVKGTIFPKWQNNLEKDAAKMHEIKHEVEKVEFKGRQKVKKVVEVRSFLIKRRVTQGFLDRQKIKPFGIGNNEDDLRQNINLTSIQRENVWHPYYESKVEEEDFKDKIRNKKLAALENAGNQDITELEKAIKLLEEKDKQEQQDQLDAASGTKKKMFDLKSLQDKKREEDKYDSNIPQEDPYTVKLRNLSCEISEDDIFEAMKKFGEIIKVKIPVEELRNGKTRMYGFAFVTYRNIDEAQKALAEREVNVEYATLEIEKALKRAAPQKEGMNKMQEFEQLKRRQ